MEDLINRIRFFHFISGVLAGQQEDPVCRRCKAFSNTVRWTLEGISSSETVMRDERLSSESLGLLSEARQRTEKVVVSDDAVGQKKAGNCRMPQGVCFVKIPKSIMEKL